MANQPTEQQPQQIQVNPADELSRGRYSNNILIAHNQEEFILDWMLNSPNGTHNRVNKNGRRLISGRKNGCAEVLGTPLTTMPAPLITPPATLEIPAPATKLPPANVIEPLFKIELAEPSESRSKSKVPPPIEIVPTLIP